MARTRQRIEDMDFRNDPDDAVTTIIPYKNVPALISYYLGILALLPLIGLLPGIAALILGILGLKKRAANPSTAEASTPGSGLSLAGAPSWSGGEC